MHDSTGRCKDAAPRADPTERKATKDQTGGNDCRRNREYTLDTRLSCRFPSEGDSWRAGLCVEAENKVDDDGQEEHDGKDGGAETVVIGAGATVSDGACSPVVCQERVDHDGHSDKGEHGSRNAADPVTKVEQTRSQSREGDGEVEP